MRKPAYHPNDFKRYTGIYRLHRISLPKVLALIASPYGQTTIKRRNRKEKQELPLVNIEQNDSLIEKEKRIGKKVIICFFFF